jgi:hypothetical protein
MEKNLKKPMLNVNYVVINEVTKFKWAKAQLNNFLVYIWRGENINPIKIGWNRDFWK